MYKNENISRRSFSFAPMEGVTGYPFRNAHAKLFPGTDDYYSPFIAANQNFSYKMREKKDTLPVNNELVHLVPQILTNNAEIFVWSVKQMQLLGYTEANLNLGCPSATVTTRGKGAGFLQDTDKLDAFFENVFDLINKEDVQVQNMKISVKTRTGFESSEEANELIRIYNRYPISEVTVHPRFGKQAYRGVPDLEAFQMFYDELTKPIQYNGDIRTAEGAAAFFERFPNVLRVMIGRGLIIDPALVRQLKLMEEGKDPKEGAVTVEELEMFHDRILDGWMADMGNFHNCLGKMKELWFYFGCHFPDASREMKKVRKARSEEEYRIAARNVFHGDGRFVSSGELFLKTV